MLVAAGQLRGQRVVVHGVHAGVHAEPIDHLLGQGAVALLIDDAEGRNPVQRADANVLANPQRREQPFFVAVFGDEANAGAARGRHVVAGDSLTLDAHRAGGAPFQPRDGAQELALSTAFDAGHADDLARVRYKADIREARRGQPLYFEHRLTDARRLVWIDLSERAPGNHRHDLVGCDASRRAAVDAPAVAQNRDVVGQLLDLGQPVRDVDDSDAFLTKPFDEVEQLLDVLLLERLRGFVEHQHLGLGGECLGQLDDMFLSEREIADPRTGGHRVSFGRHAGEHALRFRPAVRAGKLRRRKLEVFQHRQVFRQFGMLEGYRQAGPAQFLGIGLLHFLAANAHDYEVGLDGAGDDPDERRFPGAVLADDRVDLSAPNVQVDGPERVHGAVGFRGPHDPQHGRGHKILGGAHVGRPNRALIRT